MVRSPVSRVVAATAAVTLMGVSVTPAFAQTASSITVRDGAGTNQVIGTGTANSKLFYGFYAAGSDGSVSQPATAARQDSGNTALTTLSGTVGSTGQVQGTAQTVTVVLPQLTLTDVGGSFGTSATQLVAANTSRRFLRIQVQGAADSSGTVGCWINGSAAATADYHSLFISRGGLFESSTEVGTGAISIICSAPNTQVFARQG